MIIRRAAFASVALCGALALSGCTADAERASAEATSSLTPITDEVTCDAFGDVSTIVGNADAGLRDGRMAEQEQQGWYRLAQRVLDRVPTTGDGAVSDAVAALKAIAPASIPGASATPSIGSDEWESARAQLAEACNDAGYEMWLAMFTGG